MVLLVKYGTTCHPYQNDMYVQVNLGAGTNKHVGKRVTY